MECVFVAQQMVRDRRGNALAYDGDVLRWAAQDWVDPIRIYRGQNQIGARGPDAIPDVMNAFAAGQVRLDLSASTLALTLRPQSASRIAG